MVTIWQRLQRMDWSDWLTLPLWLPLRAVIALVFWVRELWWLWLTLMVGGTVSEWWEDCQKQFEWVYNERDTW